MGSFWEGKNAIHCYHVKLLSNYQKAHSTIHKQLLTGNMELHPEPTINKYTGCFETGSQNLSHHRKYLTI